MRVWAKANQTTLLIAGMTAAGFALTLYVFYPGVMTFDAFYVYKDMPNSNFGDWQSPAMLALWSLIDPIAPGMGSMLLLTVALYWLTFAVAALTIARHSPQLAVLLPILALSPPAFVLVGVIWRDILFAIVWMLGAAAVFAAADHERKLLVPVQIIAFGLFLFGILLRPNALAAAPILAAYIIWPKQFSWKRTALLYVPAALALFGLVQVIYYGVFDAKRQHPLHSIIVFDLGGISNFAKENVFPGTWTTTGVQAYHRRLLQADRMGHLLDAGAVFVRDGASRRRSAVRYACSHRCLAARGRCSSHRLSGAPRHILLDVPRRREP